MAKLEVYPPAINIHSPSLENDKKFEMFSREKQQVCKIRIELYFCEL